jgi:4a-hydroxytetrahydrobiopterin dehydratase
VPLLLTLPLSLTDILISTNLNLLMTLLTPLKLLSNSEINDVLKSLPLWSYEEGHLHRVITFHDFASAFSFMTRASLLSEGMKHHPSWSNYYNRVSISLSTHDAGGITQRDVEWAKQVSEWLPELIS